MLKVSKISTGSYDLNKWLHGGYEKGIITMIAGPPGSGKTNFAILTAVSQAKKNKKILFIDTEGGFSSDRVKQIIEDANPVLKNILILEPSSFSEQKEIFKKLSQKIKENTIELIIVDSMAMLYRLELGDAIKDKEVDSIRNINREVSEQMRFLSEIARKKKISVLITNQVYKEFQKEEDWRAGKKAEFNIVGGDLFKYWSKCIIELTIDKEKRKAFLMKHRSLPPKTMAFDIKDKGIFKKGWI